MGAASDSTLVRCRTPALGPDRIAPMRGERILQRQPMGTLSTSWARHVNVSRAFAPLYSWFDATFEVARCGVVLWQRLTAGRGPIRSSSGSARSEPWPGRVMARRYALQRLTSQPSSATR